MSYKPDGYPDLSPYLIVSDPEAVMRFAEAAFGASRLRVIPRMNKEIMHAELKIGDSVLMMGGMDGAPASHVHLYCPDPRGWHAAALKAGATEAQAMEDQGDGDLRGGVSSPDGTTWWLACQL